MSSLDRRRFLQSGLGLGGALLLGCESRALDFPEPDASAGAGGASDGDPLAGGVRLGVAPFVNETDTPLDRPFNSGLDGRLYTDLSGLDAEHLITPNATFYIRTRTPDQLVSETPWRIRVTGAVDGPAELVLDELAPLARPAGAVLLECSGNARGAAFGLLSSAEWDGIPFASVLERVAPRPEAARVLISGFDRHSRPSAGGQSVPGASWVFGFDDLARTGAFLATRMNGEPLPSDHGAPVRLIVPGWYGCTCIKWVDEIRLVGEDEPATSQMLEFASRTHQNGTPELARAFAPAEIDVAAMPVRVEKWRIDERIVYRVVGVVWGGALPAAGLEIRFGAADFVAVDEYAPPASTRSWALFGALWQPPAPGTYAIVLRATGPDLRTRRLDRGYYLREVAIDEV